MSEVLDAEIVDNSLATRNQNLAVAPELTIEELVAQVAKVQSAMKSVMHLDEHYGTIPGTNKPTLYKPGAEKLMLLFRLAPSYDTDKTFHDDGHLTVTAICNLVHGPTGIFVAAGEGMCSTKETKYAWRKGTLACPDCGNAETLKKSKKQGEGWYCWAKIGGCGNTFAEDEQRIKSQNPGRIANPDIADQYNTVLKMACKRALIAAVLNGTAASDIFTQDVEDFSKDSGSETSRASEPQTAGVPPAPAVSPDNAEGVGAQGGGEVTPNPDPVLRIRTFVGDGAGVKDRRMKVLAAANKVLLETDSSLIPAEGLSPKDVTSLPEEILTRIADEIGAW